MSARTNRRRVSSLFYGRFHAKFIWRSAQEQALLDAAPVGREFGSPDYERLQVLDRYADGVLPSRDAMALLGISCLEDLYAQTLSAGRELPHLSEEGAKASAFVREAVARMRAAPRFLSQEAWDDLASYDGPIGSGDPEGRVPENLEDDDNE